MQVIVCPLQKTFDDVVLSRMAVVPTPGNFELNKFLSFMFSYAPTGDEVMMTDFLLWPTFERLLSKGFIIDSDEMPTLAAWLDNMGKLTAVIDIRNTANGYRRYWDSQKSGHTKYDLDLEVDS